MKGNIFASKFTIDRMALYFRETKIIESEGIAIISSEKLGYRLGISPEIIRKDLSSFGGFGMKGIGYSVSELRQNIAKSLSLFRDRRIAIVGFGNLGQALASYHNINDIGFKVGAIFDNNVTKIGRKANGIIINSIDRINEVVKACNIQIGVIAVPAQSAQIVANKLIDAGIRGIWNFSPIILKVPDNIVLISEDLTVNLFSFSYYLGQEEALEIVGK